MQTTVQTSVELLTTGDRTQQALQQLSAARALVVRAARALRGAQTSDNVALLDACLAAVSAAEGEFIASTMADSIGLG